MIRLTPDGFSIIDRDGTERYVPWASVKEIVAFKLDLVTHDAIRLGFRASDDGTYWDIDEDDAGFRELVAEVERRFDLGDRNWWSKVAFPAFATNRATLWPQPG